ncbi:MAG: enoyl-CoA hydratase-related protein [Pseudomonadales bacterium]|jgi:enoyl-CoA hydratase|nr:enoyl-CoA hydratase-related protein [Pseudomonadales bacterium]MDP6471228.1 enoyl-CoA hydratase-related protein [Pseudomonadales bacterium]MDP6825583.1 enoyl-CoA hydratase-related protein [Pseudomonadales bacterium]MDP6972950.1 enoyl-CoA hydratase-related protein [Pseudomonadales bacterium]|tara:strand:+ start:2292 stop:3080 length:789 start_codon:yes stop_codon:yes gene_type:complete
MTEPLLVSVSNAVATLSINDAPYNRMTLDYMDVLEETLPKLAEDEKVRAIVFTAEGEDNFSVGMNLKQFPEGIARKGSADAVFDQRLRVLNMIEHLGKPSIATLFGYCLGGGLELPLACHFRLAADQGAQIGLPEMDLGAVPAWGGSARLPRCVGRDQALDMILRGRKIDGEEALRMGLVTEICPIAVLKIRAQEIGEELARQPRLAVKGMLETIVGFESRSLAESLLDERAAVHLTRGTPDAAEGMRAFLEKRDPVFNQES